MPEIDPRLAELALTRSTLGILIRQLTRKFHGELSLPKSPKMASLGSFMLFRSGWKLTLAPWLGFDLIPFAVPCKLEFLAICCRKVAKRDLVVPNGNIFRWTIITVATGAP